MSTSLLVPLKADAFILNEQCCDSDDYKIAPISQPNYTFLRLDNHLLEADLLDHVDLHAAKPAYRNARLTDLGTGFLRRNRLGVYVHWALPPFYRQGEARAPGGTEDVDPQERAKMGFPSRSTDEPSIEGAEISQADPEFRPVPNRWLVIRRLKPGSYQPSNAKIDRIEAWIIQSDALRKLSVDESLDNLDLEVDVSPFVDTDLVRDGKPREDIIESQAEVFVGKKVRWKDWNAAQANQEPSVDLNVMTSANPLLPDYQIHNPNIFSLVDNFAYQENSQTKYLDEAKADYCIIGWHSDDDDDPMNTAAQIAGDQVPSHEERMAELEMKLKEYNISDDQAKAWIKDAAAWLGVRQEPARSDTRIVCHSSMYDVHWKKTGFPDGLKVQASEVAQAQKRVPFSMGTSDLDALMAYWDTLAAVSEDLGDTRDQIRRLRYILGESGDGDIDGLQKFSDEAYKMAFERVDGGTAWFWKAEKSDAKPSLQDITDLDRLNMDQAALDNVEREIDSLRWKIFAIWWTLVSSFELQNIRDALRDRLAEVLNRLEVLLGTRAAAESNSILKKLRDNVEAKARPAIHSKGAANRYYQRRDPTALFSNLGSGWEPDFQSDVQVRRHTEAIKSTGNWDPEWGTGSLQNLVGFADKAPDEVQPGVRAAIEEFYALRKTGKQADEATQVLPYFYDGIRDRWNNTQPWRPLFIEWEALYYHIPYEHWDCHEYEEENSYGASAIHYHIPENVNVSKIFDDPNNPNARPDVLRIAGRDHLHPQSVGTFKVLVEEVFDNTNPESLAEHLGISLKNPDDAVELFEKIKEARSTMVQTLSQMQFVSSPLTAVSNSLLTVQEGAHLKPLVRLPHSTPVALAGASERLATILPGNRDPTNVMQLVNDQGDITPYASSVSVSRDHYPMKPVQHGQLQFIKLNIVDKFGQAIHLIDPSPPPKGHFYTTSPIISKSLFVGEYLDPSTGQKRPNTAILQQQDPSACPFISLPPAVNQPARMNACFVQKVQEEENGPWVWRRISDWDSPVWGWVVVNYADSGIQIFQEDGQFYREIRFSSSREGQVITPKYLPFDPPKEENAAKTQQLDYLIEKLTTDNTYLLAFWDMIDKSFANASFSQAPTSYSNFSTAVIGKPLALVNAGWSIELAHQPRMNWSATEYTSKLSPTRTLLKPGNGRWSERQWDETQPNPHGYTFPVKIGDDARRYDGLVGYFLPSQPDHANPTTRGADLNVNKFYTFPAFDAPPEKKDAMDPRIPITKENYPRHTPYWQAPESASEPLERHDDKLRILGLLIDPFLPVHAFSAVLPTKALQLPGWTVERALKRMWAFWHAGPLLVTRDVATSFDAGRRLDERYSETLAKLTVGKTLKQKEDAGEGLEAGAPAPVVKLPLAPPTGTENGGGAAFVYLQPYLDQEGKTVFNPYAIDPDSGVGADAEQARLEPGPYTALEGYVQIVKSLGEEFGAS